jgi:hypothetical protein
MVASIKSLKNQTNFRRGLHRVFLFLSILWMIGVFVYPLYTAHLSEQIYIEAHRECIQNHDEPFDLQWCEDAFHIEMNGVPKFLSLEYHGEGLVVNIAIALFVPLLAYGAIRLVIVVATWLIRGFLVAEIPVGRPE